MKLRWNHYTHVVLLVLLELAIPYASFAFITVVTVLSNALTSSYTTASSPPDLGLSLRPPLSISLGLRMYLYRVIWTAADVTATRRAVMMMLTTQVVRAVATQESHC